MLTVDLVHSGGRYPQVVAEYLSSFDGSQVRQFQVPGWGAVLMEDAADLLPEEIGASDVVVAVAVYQDVLVELPYLMEKHSGRALIAPIEDPNWIRPGLVGQVSRICADKGIECAFPKPFCALQPQTRLIGQFCEQYQIGKPELHLDTADGVITAAEFVRGAPCGLTRWVAEQLVGHPVDESLIQTVKTLHHARPCLASMALDPVLGETVKHLSVDLIEYAARTALEQVENK